MWPRSVQDMHEMQQAAGISIQYSQVPFSLSRPAPRPFLLPNVFVHSAEHPSVWSVKILEIDQI